MMRQQMTRMQLLARKPAQQLILMAAVVRRPSSVTSLFAIQLRSNAIAVAVRVVAEVGAAAHRSSTGGLGEYRVVRGRLAMIGPAEPIGAPFPHIATDIDQAKSVG